MSDCPICGHKAHDEAETTTIEEKLRAKAKRAIDIRANLPNYAEDEMGREYIDSYNQPDEEWTPLKHALAVLRGHDTEHKHQLNEWKSTIDAHLCDLIEDLHHGGKPVSAKEVNNIRIFINKKFEELL